MLNFVNGRAWIICAGEKKSYVGALKKVRGDSKEANSTTGRAKSIITTDQKIDPIRLRHHKIECRKF